MIDDLVRKCRLFLTLGEANLLVVDSSTGERRHFQTYRPPEVLEELLNAELEALCDKYGSLLDDQVIRYRDQLGFCYLVYILEGYAENNYMVAFGPYAEEATSAEVVRVAAFRAGLSAEMVKTLETILEWVPVYQEEKLKALYNVLTSLLRSEIIDVEPIDETSFRSPVELEEVVEKFRHYDFAEQNYAVEALMMRAIEGGDVERVKEMIRPAVTRIPIPTRHRYDPLRNAKNLGITLNSLGARAALHGGLTPHLVHSISTKYAVAIERCTNAAGVNALLAEAAVEYASQVRYYSLAAYSPMVIGVITDIRQHLSQPVSLEDLADCAHVSKEHLSREFHKETGQTVTGFIHSTKVRESLRLVQDGSISVEEIAESLAFCNAGYFSMVFKKVMGMTVRQYRLTCRNAHKR